MLPKNKPLLVRMDDKDRERLNELTQRIGLPKAVIIRKLIEKAHLAPDAKTALY